MTKTDAALDAIRATCSDYDAAMRETHRELGRRRMQVQLLRDGISIALAHDDGPAMRRVLREALTLGADLATGADVVRGASLDATVPPERP